MKTKLLILIPIVVGLSVSVPLIISNTSGGTHYTQEIDPRFSEVTRSGFAITSNMDIYSITVEDEINGLSITTSKNNDGFIHMDDPTPILQKLFPEKDIFSFIVMSNGKEMPYTLENGKLGLSVNNSGAILIKGIFKI